MPSLAPQSTWRTLAAAALLLACSSVAHAFERVTLNTGFSIDCIRREPIGDKLRLYLAGSASGPDANYLDVAASSVVSVEVLPDPPVTVLQRTSAQPQSHTEPTATELHEMLTHAGSAHHIDAELLASVVHAESGFNVHAVSRTGARGLMQLMPGTASEVGVADAFAPDQNIAGGTAYLDAMLIRYHDNLANALAAYNAGPGAVDRFHGVPPFRETRAYVARVIREFNRRKTLALHEATLAQATPER